MSDRAVGPVVYDAVPVAVEGVVRVRARARVLGEVGDGVSGPVIGAVDAPVHSASVDAVEEVAGE